MHGGALCPGLVFCVCALKSHVFKKKELSDFTQLCESALGMFHSLKFRSVEITFLLKLFYLLGRAFALYNDLGYFFRIH